MANIKLAYGASTAITITMNSLASTAARESTAVDNTANLFEDALLMVQFKLVAGTPADKKAVLVYAYGSEDGTNYSDNATGTDAGLTMRDPTNLFLLQTIVTPDLGALVYKGKPVSVAKAFDWVLPIKWGIVLSNRTGLAFDSVSNVVRYTGIFGTSV